MPASYRCVLARSLSIVVIVLALAGCGGGDEEPSTIGADGVEVFGPRTSVGTTGHPTAAMMVDIMRRNGLRSSDVAIRWRMEAMGMTLFDPPTVAGWGENGYWLSTARAWAKSRFTNNLKWSADDRGVLQNLEDRTANQVVNAILNFYSIFDVSAQTRAQMVELIETTREESPWAMSHVPFAVGMMMPEVQCA